jgi:hypothetical protein
LQSASFQEAGHCTLPPHELIIPLISTIADEFTRPPGGTALAEVAARQSVSTGIRLCPDPEKTLKGA